MLAVYIDDCILVAKTTKLIKRAVQKLADILTWAKTCWKGLE